MASKNSIKAIPMTAVASTAFTGSYQLLSAAGGIPNACFLLKIVNNSDQDVSVSYDGTTDNDFVPKGAMAQLPFQNNSQPNNFIANIPQGTKVYIKGTAGMAGSVYLVGYYSPQA